MPKLPVISGKKVVKAFQALGWEVVRQRGSHIIMVKSGSHATLSIPNHKTIAVGTLSGLIRSAGVTVIEFNQVCR